MSEISKSQCSVATTSVYDWRVLPRAPFIGRKSIRAANAPPLARRREKKFSLRTTRGTSASKVTVHWSAKIVSVHVS